MVSALGVVTVRTYSYSANKIYKTGDLNSNYLLCGGCILDNLVNSGSIQLKGLKKWFHSET